MPSHRIWTWLLLATPGVIGCSGSDTSSRGAAGSIGTAGSANGGGAAVTGGANGSVGVGGASQSFGGHSATGGMSVLAGSSTGGAALGAGGTQSTGGAMGTGGAVNTGGSGTYATGGAPSSGGSKSTGGAPSSGGSKSTGGAPSSGGSKSTGGAPSSGGSKSTGGAPSTGGTSTGCYTAPATQVGTLASGGRVSGYGTVLISANANNQIVRVQTTMVVPPKPPASGTLFLWPGLDPNGANFNPINNGVLQPVLTWGPSCAPGTQPRAYSTWWISGQYVNTYGNVSGYTGCNGGPIMSVNVCDTLDMDIRLSGTVWTQTVTDVQTNQTVTYSIDMQNQAQNLAYFVIEEYSSAPVSEVIFTNTTITFASSDAADCKLNMRGQSDYLSTPVASSDGVSCSISQIILRAQGIQ
jgi:hypothetical protein